MHEGTNPLEGILSMLRVWVWEVGLEEEGDGLVSLAPAERSGD